MPVNLILEDGTAPEGANSYATAAMCDAWQSNRLSENWSVPPESGEDQEREAKNAALIKAADYLNGLNWRGRRTDGGRLMAWPRVDVVTADGYPVATNSVPEAVKAANCYLAGLVFAEIDLQPALERGGRVQTEKVGTLQTTYFDDSQNRDIYTALADLLSNLVDGFEPTPNGGSSGSGGLTFGRIVVG